MDQFNNYISDSDERETVNSPSNLDLELPATILNIGSSKSGKSHLTKHLLMKYMMEGKISRVLVFTLTRFNCDYTTWLPENAVVERFNIDILNRFLEQIKNVYGPKIKENELAKRPRLQGVPQTAIVFDDIMDTVGKYKSDFAQFISTSRHYGITVFINIQNVSNQVSTTIRQQCTYAFMFFNDNKNSLRKLYESYGQSLQDFDTFKNLLFKVTKVRYTCLVYVKDEYDLNKKYFAYKAPADLPDVKFEEPKKQQKRSHFFRF